MSTTLRAQILASTAIDGHGEQTTKEFLEDLVARMPQRMPLNQHHDLGQPTVGFVENLRVEPEGDGWAIKGDITFEGSPPTAGGFSYSTTERVYGAPEALLAVYVPYPYYRDDSLLAELHSHDGGTTTGRWIKKSISVEEAALIISAANLVFAPMWRRVYEDSVHPHLVRLAEATKSALFARGATRVRTDFLQPVRCEAYEGKVELYFVPPDQAAAATSFSYLAILDAMEESRKFLQEDWSRCGKKVKRVVHVFQPASSTFERTTIVYVDGSSRLVPPSIR